MKPSLHSQTQSAAPPLLLTALTAATKAGWSARRTRKWTMDTSSWSAALEEWVGKRVGGE